MLQIGQAVTAENIATIRELLREYHARLGVDLGFQGFEDEMLALPGDYAPPSGRLLLATHGDLPVGCVALRACGPTQSDKSEAQGLYEAFGFREIQPYRPNSIAGTRYLAKSLVL